MVNQNAWRAPTRTGRVRIREAADVIRRHGFHQQGIQTSYEAVTQGLRRVVIWTTEIRDFNGLKQDLIDTYGNVQIRKG